MLLLFIKVWLVGCTSSSAPPFFHSKVPSGVTTPPWCPPVRRRFLSDLCRHYPCQIRRYRRHCRPLPVRDDFRPGFFNLVIKSPPPSRPWCCRIWSPPSFLVGAPPPSWAPPSPPEPPPHRCHATSVSPRLLHPARRIDCNTSVLPPPFSPWLGRRGTLTARATEAARCAVTAP
jgi:hypothetical protein